MDILSLIAVFVALAVIVAAVSMVLMMRRRNRARAADEAAVAKAAQDYLAKFGVRARAVAATVASGHITLMIETPPHKKLRFSFIIEQPIRNFIHVQTGIAVARVFWRFPIPSSKTKVPEVRYVDPTTIPAGASNVTPAAAPLAPAKVATHTQSEEDFDDYFHHQTYHIEEVSWEDFSTLAPDLEPASTEAALPETEKK